MLRKQKELDAAAARARDSSDGLQGGVDQCPQTIPNDGLLGVLLYTVPILVDHVIE